MRAPYDPLVDRHWRHGLAHQARHKTPLASEQSEPSYCSIHLDGLTPQPTLHMALTSLLIQDRNDQAFSNILLSRRNLS
jgi:hypothetical protein